MILTILAVSLVIGMTDAFAQEPRIEVTGIQTNETILLDITIHNMIELEEKLLQCELDGCQTLSQIYNFLQSQENSNINSQFFDLLFLLLPIITGVAGLYGGHRLLEHSRIKRKETDLKKIKRLINLDFSRLRHISKIMENGAIIINEAAKKNNISFKNIHNEIQISETIGKLLVQLKFYHWKTLENSGSLIKLKPTEIQLLQFAHDQIFDMDSNMDKPWNKLAETLHSSLNSEATFEKMEVYRNNEILWYLKSLLIGYGVVNDAFSTLKFDWIDLDLHSKEFPKQQKEISKFNFDKK